MHGFGTDLLRAALVAALTGGTALAQDAPRPAVVVAPAEVADLRFGVTYTGRVVAAQKVELRARVSGFLEEIHFTEGQTVAAGDVLFSIQDEAYAAAVREAEGTVRAAEAERDLARLERDRKATLVQRQAVAQNELDVAAGAARQDRGPAAAAQRRARPTEARALLHPGGRAVRRARRTDELRRRRAGRPGQRAARHPDPARHRRGRDPGRDRARARLPRRRSRRQGPDRTDRAPDAAERHRLSADGHARLHQRRRRPRAPTP